MIEEKIILNGELNTKWDYMETVHYYVGNNNLLELLDKLIEKECHEPTEHKVEHKFDDGTTWDSRSFTETTKSKYRITIERLEE